MNHSPTAPGDGNLASPWPKVLFWVTVAVVLMMTVQQAMGGSGNPYSRTIAFAIPMLFPLGMALWGMRAGLKGPALGGIAMAVLFWIALLLSPGE
jgi:hypothetical protein